MLSSLRLFHGRENENFDRWLQRFSLYLANGNISPSSDQAAVKLVLHLSGPAETFYYNLPSSVQASYILLRDALKERFSPAHRHLRNQQELSKRRQGPSGHIQAEVLKKEPKTYTEAEDTARLIYSVQESTLQRKEEDVSLIVQPASCVPSTTNAGATLEVRGALARIQHQLDNVMSTMAKTPLKSEAVINAPRPQRPL